MLKAKNMVLLEKPTETPEEPEKKEPKKTAKGARFSMYGSTTSLSSWGRAKSPDLLDSIQRLINKKQEYVDKIKRIEKDL